MDEITLTQNDFGALAVCAIRYCQGRRSYMPSLIQGILKNHIKSLSDKDLSVMIDDCEFQEHTEMYGDERIDKPGWLEWRNLLIEEKEKRAKKDEL